MIEGAVIGDQFEYEESNLKEEFFRGADLICIEPGEVRRVLTSNNEGVLGHDVFAIYGDKVVTTFLESTLKKQFYECNKDKMIMVRNKPYIINGESITCLNS